MEKLLFVPEVMERYQVSAPTARKIMREMSHIEKPKLAVTESAVRAYEQEMQVRPGEKEKAPGKKRQKAKIKAGGWVPGVSRIPLRSA